MTRTQFALQALVSAGLVSQFKVDQALALFPASSGEPEMPEAVAYWWSPKDAGMAGTWSSNTGPHPDWDVTHYFTADQLRAYGDARAEHALRVAPGYVLVPVQPTRAMWTAGSDHCRHEDGDDTHTAIGRAIAVWSDMVAAAPPQGEPK